MDRDTIGLVAEHLVLLERKVELKFDILQKQTRILQLEEKYGDDPQERHRNELQRYHEELQDLQRRLAETNRKIEVSLRNMREVP